MGEGEVDIEALLRRAEEVDFNVMVIAPTGTPYRAASSYCKNVTLKLLRLPETYAVVSSLVDNVTSEMAAPVAFA